LLDSLKQKLVRCREGGTSRADGSELEKKKLIGLYYSAHWCGPCRKFTPQLVEYYNRVAPAHPEFEIIFVSADRSRFAWETYIQETKMPWLAIDYDQLADMTGVKTLGGDGIPSLLVVDEGSHIDASSYDGDKYLAPKTPWLPSTRSSPPAGRSRRLASLPADFGFGSRPRSRVGSSRKHRFDGDAGAAHQIEIEVEIVQGDQSQTKNFLSLNEVANVAPRKLGAGWADAAFFDRALLQNKLRVL
jgi:thiol-disulfide isomerase/thioredoxin